MSVLPDIVFIDLSFFDESQSLAKLREEQHLLQAISTELKRHSATGLPYVVYSGWPCDFGSLGLAHWPDPINVPAYAPGPTLFTEELSPLLRAVPIDLQVVETTDPATMSDARFRWIKSALRAINQRIHRLLRLDALSEWLRPETVKVQIAWFLIHGCHPPASGVFGFIPCRDARC